MFLFFFFGFFLVVKPFYPTPEIANYREAESNLARNFLNT